MPADSLETIANLAKKRGFVYPASEIYGGLRSAWDYGPLGVELLRNVRDAWWQAVVRERDDVVGLDSSVILAPQVWVASGHLASFTDPWWSAPAAITGSASTSWRTPMCAPTAGCGAVSPPPSSST